MKRIGLYTLIMDFRGGTYISQVRAKNEKDALIKGISNLNLKGIQYVGEKIQQLMLREARDEEVLAINDTQNVFIACLLPAGHFTKIHIIRTDEMKE